MRHYEPMSARAITDKVMKLINHGLKFVYTIPSARSDNIQQVHRLAKDPQAFLSAHTHQPSFDTKREKSSGCSRFSRWDSPHYFLAPVCQDDEDIIPTHLRSRKWGQSLNPMMIYFAFPLSRGQSPLLLCFGVSV